AGVQQRECTATNAGHRCAAVAGEHFRDDAERVGELFFVRESLFDRSLRERAVTDLAPARTAHRAGLTDRKRREVVVVHETLSFRWREVIELLLLAKGAQRKNA